MENDDLSFEAHSEVSVHILDHMTGPYNDGLPFSAGFNFADQPTKWVNLQTEDSDTHGEELLVKFIGDFEGFDSLKREDADFIMHRDENGHWVDSERNVTPDIIGVSAIIDHLIAKAAFTE